MKTATLHALALLTLAAPAVLPTVAQAHDSHRHDAFGTVVVRNGSGTLLRVTLDGGAVRTLLPGEVAPMTARVGEATLRATYDQFGVERTLTARRVAVAPHHDNAVTLAPATLARVLVVNESREAATVVIDGRYRTTLRPGESQVLTADLGWTDVVLTATDGRLLERQAFEARAYVEHRVVAPLPRIGDLVVANPFPFAIELIATQGTVRTVAAGARTVYENLPAGPFALRARRAADDRPIDAETVFVPVGGVVDWRIEAPRTGTLLVDSDEARRLSVYVDGRRLSVLDPFEHEVLTLPVGPARLEVRDERGVELLDRMVEIRPFDDARLVVVDPRDVRADGYIAEYDPDDAHAHRGGRH